MAHEHEAWQIQDDGEGNHYCAACGQGVLLTQCRERESGGWQCEALLVTPDQKHNHFVTPATIEETLGGYR